MNRYEIPAIASGLRAALRGGAAYSAWVLQYVALLKRIPVNYSAAFCHTVLEVFEPLSTLFKDIERAQVFLSF